MSGMKNTRKSNSKNRRKK